MATSVPFDEEEDAASVAKGLAMLHAHPELGPGEAFKGRAPVRSSLQTLRMPFEYAPLEDDEEEGATRSFRISEPKILEVHYQCFTFGWSTLSNLAAHYYGFTSSFLFTRMDAI